MNLTKIREVIEELERERKEREAEKEWQKVKAELKIKDLKEGCCVNRIIG